jgi:rubrerythrin
MNLRTQKNLLTAMHGEAFAYIKYMLFAEHARKNGQVEIADLFEKTAHVERFEHLAEESALANLVGSVADNLGNAFESETDEVNTMYREFAEQAAMDGDHEAASRFTEVREDEMGHRDAFQAALIKVSQRTQK